MTVIRDRVVIAQGKARRPKELEQRADLRVSAERVRGIEPPLRAWEARVLPLNYTRGSGPDDTGQAGTAASVTAPGPALAAQSLATSPTGQDTPVPPMPQ